ncbi:DNA-binding protein [Arthrobacter agilis]|uniref:DNA-binding protein n=1 Tax=Arthrobacter agilis TaxID=37921 RepID=UPI0027880B8C|nr:DNA-binding protein [Arthrobacter agilis]MDQ0734663.1 excisionase family DNA binding protein [Arthrobacter agilis]
MAKDSTIRGLIKTGDLSAIRVGGRVQRRIERVKLEEYILGAYLRDAADIKRCDIDDLSSE